MPRILIAAITAATLLLFLGPRFIAWLRANEVGQFVRPQGLIPEGHAEKQGTPTMGGLLILLAMALPFVILSSRSTEAMLVLFVTLACGAIGFVDDFMKIVRKRSLGLSGRLRMLGLVVVSIVLVIVATEVVGLPSTLDLGPFGIDSAIELGPFGFFVLVFVVIAGSANGVNLTDGLDGLAAGTCSIALLAYTAMAFVSGRTDLAIFGAAMCGACVGFLWFNSFPASVFMGDTGSYALGGAIAAMAVMTKTEVLLGVIGAVFVAEALSVMIQVVVFQRFRRRVFLMAPLHHHFEMANWSETKIIVRFWLIALIFGAVGFTLYYRYIQGVRTVLVIGLGRSGRAAAELLARRGDRVVAVDSRGAQAPELTALGVDVRAPFADPVPGVDLVVKSPGVPQDVPQVVRARAEGAAVWSEVELAGRYLRNPIVGITGTNGKTTTTELTAHLLRAGDRKAVACGNQGLPVTALVDGVDPAAWLVVECSSFQLEDTDRFHPRAAVLLNLTPDHLDRHGTMEAYRDAKLRIFRNMEPGELAIAPAGMGIPGRATPRVVEDGPRTGAATVAWSQAGLHVEGAGRIVRWREIPLRGAHNRHNAMAAAAVAIDAGVRPADVARGLRTFPGVPHRLERVAERGGVEFVNDSKATNPDAAVAALDAYPHGVHLIAGGSGKGTPFGPMARAARGAVVCAYLVGRTARELRRDLEACGVPTEMCGTLDVAVRAAARRARPGEVVLLAPGCASFDQWSSFEERGDAFRSLATDPSLAVGTA